MAFRWRADAAGPSLNTRMITVIFQGIRTRIAEKPYIFVIFREGGVLIRGCPMAANLSAAVRFFVVALIVLAACLIMWFSIDERGHLGEKNQLQTTFIFQGCCTVLCP